MFIRASFCPTRGSMAAFAKWKMVALAAKTRSGRDERSTERSDGWSCACAAPVSSPRAWAWSIAAAGIESVTAMLATARTDMTQNTTTGPNQYAVAAAMAAAAALPPWLKASLRPTRRANARGPTIPSVIAASDGANSDPAAPVKAFITARAVKPGIQGRASEPKVTTAAAAMSMARLAVVESTRAPAGVCATIPAMPPMDITKPIAAWSQCCTVKR